MKIIEGQLDYLVDADIRNRSTNRNENISRYLIRVYYDRVHELLPELSQLVDSLLFDKTIFNQTRWNRITDCYKEMDSKTELSEPMRPYDLTNLSWLKIIEIFEHAKANGYSYEAYLTKRKEAQTFFKSLWNYLI